MAIRLGGHGLPIGSEDPYAFARAHRAFGYGAAYVPEVRLDDRDRLSAIEQAFAAENVVLAEIGIWRNLVSPDEAVRKANLAYAVSVSRLPTPWGPGARSAISARFRPAPTMPPAAENMSPEAFDASVETVRHILDAAKPKRARFGARNDAVLPAGQRRQLCRADPRRGAADVRRAFRPVNLIMTPRVYFDNGALIRECFDKLGQWVVSCPRQGHQAAPPGSTYTSTRCRSAKVCSTTAPIWAN